jgi:hypothetical protein
LLPILAERTGLAYILQAAESLVGDSLQVPTVFPAGEHSLLPILAERTGLEPATSDVTGRHSNQLNYHSRKYAVLLVLPDLP